MVRVRRDGREESGVSLSLSLKAMVQQKPSAQVRNVHGDLSKGESQTIEKEA